MQPDPTAKTSTAWLDERSSSFIFTPEDRENGEPERELETARYEGSAEDDRWHVRKDGSCFFASGILTALYDQGTPDGFTKILRDLTRQRQAEEERERLVTELKTLNNTLERRVKERTRRSRRVTRSSIRASSALPKPSTPDLSPRVSPRWARNTSSRSTTPFWS
jgi:hypothetical protein